MKVIKLMRQQNLIKSGKVTELINFEARHFIKIIGIIKNGALLIKISLTRVKCN